MKILYLIIFYKFYQDESVICKLNIILLSNLQKEKIPNQK